MFANYQRPAGPYNGPLAGPPPMQRPPAPPYYAATPGYYAPAVSQRGNFAECVAQVGAQRITDYGNTVTDLVQVLLNPAQAFDQLKAVLLDNLGNAPAPGFLGFLQAAGGIISLVLRNFVSARITPYVTAFKESKWEMLSALAVVDVVDFLTFAVVFKGAETVIGAMRGTTRAASTLSGTMLRYGKYWTIGNAIGANVVSTIGGIPRDQLYATYMALAQNGLVLNQPTYALFGDLSFTDGERYRTFHRMIKLNRVNYVAGPILAWQPGRPQNALKGSVAPAMVQRAELDYLRFISDGRFSTLQKLCDLNGGYGFFQHAFMTVPDAQRANFAVILEDLYAYHQFVTGFAPGYQLNADPARDIILTVRADARELATAAYMQAFPGTTRDQAVEVVKRFWQTAMPVGERPMGSLRQ